jgi:hypothetical protein
LSTPVEGALIAGNRVQGGYVLVYADGRVIWSAFEGSALERRLRPAGVALVRSGAIRARDLVGLSAFPASAWEEPEAKLYAPPRYAICPSREVDLLPAPAQALLRGKEHNYPTPAQALLRGQEHNYPHECFEVTTEEARALEDILNDAGLKTVNGFLSRLGLAAQGDRLRIEFRPLFPDGHWPPVFKG